MTAVVLSQVHPTIRNRRNSYRERWATVNGDVYHVYADGLYTVWTIEDDTEPMSGREALAKIESDGYFCRIAFTLAEAREIIAAEADRRKAAS